MPCCVGPGQVATEPCFRRGDYKTRMSAASAGELCNTDFFTSEKCPAIAHCREGTISGLGACCLTARSRLDSPIRHL
jgi:hypothetical protein